MMIVSKIVGAVLLASVAVTPAMANLTGGERKALLAAGCKIQEYPNPTNKYISRPPAVYCSSEARLALNKARDAAATGKVASAKADTNKAVE